MNKIDRSSPLILKYTKQLKENPDSLAFAPLGEIYRKMGLLEQAKEILIEGLRRNSSHVLGYVTLAECYFDEQQFSLATSTLRPLAGVNRENIKLQKIYGIACKETGYDLEALEALKFVLYYNPHDELVAILVKSLETEQTKAQLSNTTQDDRRGEFILSDSSQSSTTFQEEALDHWKMDAPARDQEEEEEEEEVVLVSAKENQAPTITLEELDEESTSTPPFQTMTLVDLYIGQKHFTKALEVLDEMIKSSPKNQVVQNKRNAVLNLIATSSPTESVKKHGAEEDDLMASYDEKVLKPQTIKLTRQEQFLKRFSHLIREKARSKQLEFQKKSSH